MGINVETLLLSNGLEFTQRSRVLRCNALRTPGRKSELHILTQKPFEELARTVAEVFIL